MEKYFYYMGQLGLEKTSLAFKIKRDLSDDYNIIYINGEYEKDKDINDIIEKKQIY